MTPHRVRRAEAQAEIAAEADRIRYVLGVDQADLAEAIGTGPTHVQHLLARRDPHTVTLADVVLAAESGQPGAAQWAEDLVGYLATRLGCRLERSSDPIGEVVLHAAEAAAHAGAAVQGAARAAADGVVDEREALREGPPSRAEWLGAPAAQPQCPTCAAAEAWADRSQRALDEERQRGAALAAAVRIDCVGREEEGAGGVNTLPVELRAALVAYEGRGE